MKLLKNKYSNLKYRIIYKVDNKRKWLEKNKVFFETIGFIALTIMAIIVSFYTLDATLKQTEVLKNEHQPEFSFLINHTINFSSKSYEYHEIIIENKGFSAFYHDTRLHEYIFLKKDAQIPYLIKDKYYQLWIPALYNSSIQEYPNETGWISKTWVDKELNNMHKIGENYASKINNYYTLKGWPISAQFVTLLELTYLDVDDKLHYKSYNILPYGIFPSLYGHNELTRDMYSQEFISSIILTRESMSNESFNNTIEEINKIVNSPL